MSTLKCLLAVSLSISLLLFHMFVLWGLHFLISNRLISKGSGDKNILHWRMT